MISLSFVYFFLPVFILAYYFTPPKLKWVTAVAGSVVYLFSVDPAALIPLTVSYLSAYICGIIISNSKKGSLPAKIGLASAVMLNSAVYLLFHRTAYDGADLITSIGGRSLFRDLTIVGAAVYPLNAVSYCIDIYRGKYKCEDSFGIVAEYISFLPTLPAGPLLRFDKLRDRLKAPEADIELGAKGVRLFCLGLFRKILLSNTVYELWRNIMDVPPDSLPMITAWIGMAAFGLFVYFEISSFSYMAEGLAGLMGFDIPSNFNKPYAACSFRELVKRFNCSLFRWSHDYIYKSIAAPGMAKVFKLFAFVVTVVFGALWYGFSIRCYLFAAAIVLVMLAEKLIEPALKKLPRAVRRVLFIIVLLMILPLMAIPVPSDASAYIMAMLGANTIAVDMLSEYLIQSYLLFIVACMVISGGFLSYFHKKKPGIAEYVSTIIQPVWVIAIMLICTAFIVSGDSSVFGYMF